MVNMIMTMILQRRISGRMVIVVMITITCDFALTWRWPESPLMIPLMAIVIVIGDDDNFALT